MKGIFTFIITLLYVCVNGQTNNYESILSRYAASQHFNGTVAIMKKGETVFQQTAGTANRIFNVQLKDTTHYKICSITKTFTAVLILQLMEEGKLNLSDVIGQHLPNYRGDGRDKVSIHHLLTYSAGIPNCEHGRGMEVYQTKMPPDDFVRLYCSDGLITKPGITFSYDNGIYIILGRIIEEITGKPFRQVLSEKILVPAGMMNTGMLDDSTIIPDLAASYLRDDTNKLFYQDPPYYISNFFTAAAMYSTATDMLLFDKALFSGKLLKKEIIDLMLTPYPDLYSVAYGFWVTEETIGGHKTRVANRQGGIQGSNAQWLHAIPEDVSVIILSNTNATNIGAMAEELMGAVLK